MPHIISPSRRLTRAQARRAAATQQATDEAAAQRPAASTSDIATVGAIAQLNAALQAEQAARLARHEAMLAEYRGQAARHEATLAAHQDQAARHEETHRAILNAQQDQAARHEETHRAILGALDALTMEMRGMRGDVRALAERIRVVPSPQRPGRTDAQQASARDERPDWPSQPGQYVTYGVRGNPTDQPSIDSAG